MQNEASEVVGLPYFCTVKVHLLICLELKKFIDEISKIFSAIESTRPGSSGIRALCALHHYMDKAKLLIRHCSESSKLYLAITGEKIVLRCEKIRNNLELCLSQIQNVVPSSLAAEISKIVDHLRIATFSVESSEDEAGKLLLALLRQDIASSDSINMAELEPFQMAALRLKLASPISILTEKRSIKKLLEKIPDLTNRRILMYFLYLLKKYGKSIGRHQTENTVTQNEISPNQSIEPPSNWCMEHGIIVLDPCEEELSSLNSIASFGSSIKGLRLQVSNVSLHSSNSEQDLYPPDRSVNDGFGFDLPQMDAYSHRIQSVENNSHGVNLSFFTKLASLPWESRCKAVEDVKNQLRENQGSHSRISTSYIKPLVRFIKDAHESCDSKAQRDGAQLLLIFLKECRSGRPALNEDAIYMFSSFLDSEITKEALAIMEVISDQQFYKVEIVASGILLSLRIILEKRDSEFHPSAMKILCNLSENSDIGYHMIYLDYIPKLAELLHDRMLAEYCIKILRNLCNVDDARTAVAESDTCITSIAELFEIGTDKEQELAMDMLFSVCYQSKEFCEIVMKESIISSLVYISFNGNTKGKSIALKLLKLLKDVTDHAQECPIPNTGLNLDVEKHSCPLPREKKSSSTTFGLLGRKFSLF